ncbi:putative myosin light chain kinase [Senna tora]|uniref:Putative myosin light chain kinase n=1 Tax=Senna tora TaxID=362788 RepID=A0A834X6X1_9FABA|nr:putative myosin light chain kinase [Senna tora]
MMRDSEAGRMKHNKDNNTNTSFVIREVPIQRMKRGSSQCDNTNNNASSNSRDISGFCKGKTFCSAETMMMMDYDTPELVVFLQEDGEAVSAEDRVETESNINIEPYGANGSELCASGNHSCVDDDDDDDDDDEVTSEKCGFRNLMMMMMVVEGDQKDDDATSQTLEEEVEFSRPFSNWQIDSLTHTINNKKLEFPHSADHHYQHFPETSTTSFRPEMENSQSKSLDDDEDEEEEDNHRADSSLCTVSATAKSSTISHHNSSDSISSSTHSFTFPM